RGTPAHCLTRLDQDRWRGPFLRVYVRRCWRPTVTGITPRNRYSTRTKPFKPDQNQIFRAPLICLEIAGRHSLRTCPPAAASECTVSNSPSSYVPTRWQPVGSSFPSRTAATLHHGEGRGSVGPRSRAPCTRV